MSYADKNAENTMSFNNILKDSALEELSSSISMTKILVVLSVSVLLGLFIFLIYRLYNRNSFYNRDFNVTLALLSVVTSGIVLALQSSIVISLGMVGALSIVRFRSAIKEPLDLFFLFWSIGCGIIVGAGLFKIAVMLSLVITMLIFVLQLLPISKSVDLLAVSSEKCGNLSKIKEVVKSNTKHYVIKTKTFTATGWDIIAEVKTKDEAALIQSCLEIEGVTTATLLSHDGAKRF